MPPETKIAEPDSHPATAPVEATPWGFRRPHQIGIGVLLLLLLVFLGIQLHHRPVRWGPQVRLTGTPADLAPGKIDPNTADWASLVRLPGLGPSRVARLLAYRQARRQAHPGEKVFRQLRDLGAIPTFGPATLHQLAPYLYFH